MELSSFPEQKTSYPQADLNRIIPVPIRTRFVLVAFRVLMVRPKTVPNREKHRKSPIPSKRINELPIQACFVPFPFEELRELR